MATSFYTYALQRAVLSPSGKVPSRISSRALCRASSSSTLAREKYKPTIADPETHTMGHSLERYLQIKVHPEAVHKEKVWEEILVHGLHSRWGSSKISPLEKKDKPFNWQRPTARMDGDSRKLALQCFPGVDYVKHYASIVATYLSLRGGDPGSVSYTIPTTEECISPILLSNLREMGPVDVVVMGYVHALDQFIRPNVWQYGMHSNNPKGELFGWQIVTVPASGRKVAFLGCRVSFWGDISGYIVRLLKTLNKANEVIYVGKLGSLDPAHIPNMFIATGSSSQLGGLGAIRWQNVLEPFVEDSPRVVYGEHHTIPSVLDETKEWFEAKREKYSFVDPEIGHIASAAVESGMKFGYLHIISDNLGRKYEFDLSNERKKGVLNARTDMIREIQRILLKYFESREE
ncbi:hypothetical protein BGX38DRAFT_1273167 [Terfezia claveryi]|nr:hypothetical protein BGX38DRAFT_1273167 [Terfezia claveryi]